jgi:hypothetical protein
MSGRRAALLLAVVAATWPACGRKTPVRPPELVAPRSVKDVALQKHADGIEISWSRPTQYVDGETMDDLAGFIVERNSYSTDFLEVARVPVTDRGRFQQAKRFAWIDRNVSADTAYFYRVVAFTTDGYYSVPSGVAAVTWSPPAPSPTPGATPP